jgi:hypothetical protein
VWLVHFVRIAQRLLLLLLLVTLQTFTFPQLLFIPLLQRTSCLVL